MHKVSRMQRENKRRLRAVIAFHPSGALYGFRLSLKSLTYLGKPLEKLDTVVRILLRINVYHDIPVVLQKCG
jgi:hypothetical protein